MKSPHINLEPDLHTKLDELRGRLQLARALDKFDAATMPKRNLPTFCQTVELLYEWWEFCVAEGYEGPRKFARNYEFRSRNRGRPRFDPLQSSHQPTDTEGQLGSTEERGIPKHPGDRHSDSRDTW